MVRITPALAVPSFTSLGLHASRYNRPGIVNKTVNVRPIICQCWVTSEYATNNVCDGRCDQFVRTHQHICCEN